MITAENFRERLKIVESEKSKVLDMWLESVVLPSFTGNDQILLKPKGLTLQEAITLLKVRGFEATSLTEYEESFVYISLPPKGE